VPGFLQLVDASGSVQVLGVRLVGVNAQNGKKLLLTAALLAVIIGLRYLFSYAARLVRRLGGDRAEFWARQIVRLSLAVVLIIGIISIWFNNPSQLGSAAAFVTAGLAIASQRMITAFAGYLIILRSKIFDVGDRIVMGGVRGDVIGVGFMQTTIMEMGQPPAEQSDAPSLWVRGRQYTGRIVSITNDKIFDNPVYNYTRDFPYLWEEMHFPIPYAANRREAESIILEAARNHTSRISEMSREALEELERRYMVKREDLEPRVFFRLTDNWLEMTVRFVTEEHGIRVIKDAMSREIMDRFDEVKIGLASGTYEVVGMPELRVRVKNE
jgi:small-conductance mechanosensitive channel